MTDRLDIGLTGQTAIVIGGGPGIGEAVAQAFTAAGCTTVVADINLAIAQETADGLGANAEPRQVDVLDRDSVRALLADVTERHGAPIGVVDVVGIARGKTFDDTTDEDWDVMHNLNLRQQFVVAQEAVRVIRPGGSYVAVASLNGTISSPFNLAYGAAKAGLVSLIRSLAIEIAPKGIRVNAVAPGIIATPRMRQLFDRTGRGDEFSGAVPMKRLGRPEDVAGGVIFLVSPLAAYITGQVIGIDGGASVKYPLALLTDN